MSPDPTMRSALAKNPQTWNRYAYVMNNPLRLIDPLGLWAIDYRYGLDKKNNITVDVVVSKSQKGDDAASLAKQLGFTGKAGDKFAAQLTKQFGAGADNLQLLKMGGMVGSTFGAAEKGLSGQFNSIAQGKGNPQDADCSLTAMRTVAPNAMFGKSMNDWGIQNADNMLQNGPFSKVSPGNETTGDVFHWNGGGDPTWEHFANFLMYQDDGTPDVYSKSGAKGPYEIIPTNSPGLSGYGSVDAIYHP